MTLIKSLESILSKVGWDVFEQMDVGPEAMTTRTGELRMSPYNSRPNQKDDFIDKIGLMLTFVLAPKYIKDSYGEVQILNRVQGTDDVHPFRLNNLSGRSALAISDLNLTWTGKSFFNEDEVEPEDVAIQDTDDSDQRSVTMILPFDCRQDLTLFEHSEAHKGVYTRCPYWDGDKVNTRPLIPFGMLMESSFNLDQCKPLLMTPRSGATTQLGIQPYSFWMQQGLQRDVMAKINDVDYVLPNHMFDPRSIGDRIREGAVQVVYNGIPLSSSSFEVLDVRRRLVNIYFS